MINPTAGRHAGEDEIGGCGSGEGGWSRPTGGRAMAISSSRFDTHAARVTPSESFVHATLVEAISERLPPAYPDLASPEFELTGWDNHLEQFIRCCGTLTPGTVNDQAGVDVLG